MTRDPSGEKKTRITEAECPASVHTCHPEREFFIDNLLVRIHFHRDDSVDRPRDMAPTLSAHTVQDQTCRKRPKTEHRHHVTAINALTQYLYKKIKIVTIIA